MDLNYFDIKEYCRNCRMLKVKPFHSTCYVKCEYLKNFTKEEYSKYGYKYIDFKKGNVGIYFIKCKDFIKIGSTINIDTRIKEMQTSNPFDLDILLFLDNLDRKIEAAFHKYFYKFRHKREWFFYNNEIEKFINMPVYMIKRKTKKIFFELSDSELEIFENETVDQ